MAEKGVSEERRNEGDKYLYPQQQLFRREAGQSGEAAERAADSQK